MRFSLVAASAALLAVASAAPSGKQAPRVHEKRDMPPSQWVKRSRLPADHILPVRVGLKQRNMEEGDAALMDVSDPRSANYGKHWTPQQVHDFFAPSPETVDAVKGWLHGAGIDLSRVSHSNSKGWLEFDATTAEAESLLGTEYYLYSHEAHGRPHVACEHYSVPGDVSAHVDFITPTVHFDSLPEKPSGDSDLRRRDAEKRDVEKRAAAGMWYGPKKGSTVNINEQLPANDLTNCYYSLNPACIRALYNMPAAGSTKNLSTYGITEYAPETYLQSDLDDFFVTPVLNDAKVPIGTAPKLVKIDGGQFVPAGTEGFAYQGEPDLDLEYAMVLVYPQEITLYQAGDVTGKYAGQISFNNFLDAIDGSYCVFRGGDSKKYDEKFPDPGGYEGPQQCGGAPLTAVISTSYGYNEKDLGAKYERRQCAEYMKLGLMGTSILYSSGDYGVAGNSGQCIAANGSYNAGTDGFFNPSFPSTCPYVTSVGATQIPPGGNTSTLEEACQTVIYSGGGFSNHFAVPSYQQSAVQKYYQQHAPPYGADRYNNSQQVRGYPDVSANGARYLTAVDGDYVAVYGTSASSPTFGSIITLINNERVAKGKPTLGFLNPAFYANPGIFNDVIKGGNQGCGTAGFTAVPGWDPVTGLGTPNYTKMLAALG